MNASPILNRIQKKDISRKDAKRQRRVGFPDAEGKQTLGNNWKIHFAEFLDDLRRGLITVTDKPLLFQNEKRLEALLASTVEAVCLEQNKSLPEWTQNVPCLDEPWFVSGMEGLKAMALVESPVFFRRRNIFVLNNFLSRA